jgi:hypothetical protein
VGRTGTMMRCGPASGGRGDSPPGPQVRRIAASIVSPTSQTISPGKPSARTRRQSCAPASRSGRAQASSMSSACSGRAASACSTRESNAAAPIGRIDVSPAASRRRLVHAAPLCRSHVPSLILQFQPSDGDGIGVGVEIGEWLILGDPAAEHLPGEHQLAGFIVQFDD